MHYPVKVKGFKFMQNVLTLICKNGILTHLTTKTLMSSLLAKMGSYQDWAFLLFF